MSTDRQSDLFDGSAAKQARDEGVERVIEHNRPWVERALDLIRRFMTGEFTGEQMRITLITRGLPPPKHHNAWGALVLSARRRGLIEDTGRMHHMSTKRSHGRRTPILRRIGSP